MVSSLIFQKFSGEGLTEPPPQTPPPAFSRASPSVRASPSILGRFAPSTRASPSILGRFAPSIRASPSTLDWGPWFGPPKINSWIRPCQQRVVMTKGGTGNLKSTNVRPVSICLSKYFRLYVSESLDPHINSNLLQ